MRVVNFYHSSMISLQSKLTQNLLLFFFLNPIEERYLRELSKILKADPKNLHKKLKELEKAGLFKSRFDGQERYYSLNVNWPLYFEYKGIFKKTLEIPYAIAGELRTIRNLRQVYLKVIDFSDVQENIRLFILGNPSEKAVVAILKRLEKEFLREIMVSYIDEPMIGDDYLELI